MNTETELAAPTAW